MIVLCNVQRTIMYKTRNDLLDGKSFDQVSSSICEDNIKDFVKSNKKLDSYAVHQIYVLDNLSYRLQEMDEVQRIKRII